MLYPGTGAPDFLLYSLPAEEVSFYQFKGTPVLLVFYSADWSPVCGDQLALYNEALDFFERNNIQVLGVSVDGKWCHASFREQRNLGFPLLSDFEPKGEVARAFGVYNEAKGESERALFLIDENSIIRWSFLSDPAINPGLDGIMMAVENLKKVIP